MNTISVNGPNPYEVVVGHELTEAIAQRVRELGPSQVAIIHQPALAAPARQLAQEIGSGSVEVHLLPVPDAEGGKTLEVAGTLWDRLGEAAFSRSDVVIGMGGGAATDLAGFVAAAWMRGVRVIQVPTTLLGMVDAAVGGKTGINTAAGKNLVGAFHEPSGVFVDLERLYTLPIEDIVAGSAEIIKTGFIADPRILELYEENPADCLKPGDRLTELVTRSITVKANVVGQDLKESGLREILNYGHTFGHAVEQFENYTWRHGNAVAVGMMFVAHLARNRGLIDDHLLDRHRRILTSVGLPTSYVDNRFDDLYQVMTRDKKNRNGNIRFVAIDNQVGEMTRIQGASFDELKNAYEQVVKEGE